MKRNKILILGSSSYIGKHLFTRIGPEKALATYNKSPIENGVKFDSLCNDLSDIIKNPEEISHAVILIGDTNPETCAANPEKSEEINVTSIKKIIDKLHEWKIKPVFMSSQFIFDGKKGNYKENDEPSPILLYGKQKVEIENYLKNTDHIIIRVSKAIGAEKGDKTLFDNWIKDIEEDKTLFVATDQTMSPIYTEDLVDVILKLIELNLQGTFNCGGEKSYRRIELLDILIKEINKYKEVNPKIEKRSIHDFKLQEKRPVNVSINIEKLIKVTGIKLTSIPEVCRKIVKKYYEK